MSKIIIVKSCETCPYKRQEDIYIWCTKMNDKTDILVKSTNSKIKIPKKCPLNLLAFITSLLS